MKKEYLFAVILVCWFVMPVSATPATINFDDLASGVSVGSTYDSLGVNFADALTDNNGSLPGGTPPTSIMHSFSSYQPQPNSPIIATFNFPVSSVSLTGIDVGENGFVLSAYDAITGGNLLASDQVFGDDIGVSEFFTLSLSATGIRRVEFSQVQNLGGGDGLVFDNFVFDSEAKSDSFLLMLIPPIIAAANDPWNKYQFPVTPYSPGSYNRRSFYYDNTHLGEDIDLAEGTAIHAIADGKIIEYRSASGYGNLVVVIEHKLYDNIYNNNTFHFYDGQIKSKTLIGDKFCSISGHLKKGQLTLSKGDSVSKGDIIGYVENDLYNGDGAEHLHLGIYAGENPNTWAWCGYKSSGTYPECVVDNIVSGKELIDKLKTGLDVYDFWLKQGPYTHGNKFDAQFKLKNITKKSITIDKRALSIHDANGLFLFHLMLSDTPITIQSGSSTTGFWGEKNIQNAGSYKVVAKIYMHGSWVELAAQDIEVN